MHIDDRLRPFDGDARHEVRWVLARAFFRHTAFRGEDRSDGKQSQYRTIHGNFMVLLATDSMMNTGFHPWVIYDKFTIGQFPYLDKITAIDPSWIADLPFFQNDRMKRNWHGNFVQDSVKKALDQVRAIKR